MTTQTIQELRGRKSVRSFTGEKIKKDLKEQILEAAMNAPSAGCQQLYTILDITDPAIKEQLVHTCDEQPFIAEADLVLVFCADCRKWYEGFKDMSCEPRQPGEGDLILAVTDAAIAAQNAVTAAWSLGIGSCYIGDVMENCEEQRRLLKLPPYVFPAAMVVFGYPTDQQIRREKPKRAALEYIVFENSYPEMNSADREKLFFKSRGMDAKKDYKEWMQAFCKRKYNSDFSEEMTRSVRKYLEDFAG